jgi:hypothetical protein
MANYLKDLQLGLLETGRVVARNGPIYSSSVKIRIYEVALLANGRYEERPAPAEIPSSKTTILGVYGNAFFAAVYTLERNLPAVDRTTNAAIILTMRGRNVVMASFLAFLERLCEETTGRPEQARSLRRRA